MRGAYPPHGAPTSATLLACGLGRKPLGQLSRPVAGAGRRQAIRSLGVGLADRSDLDRQAPVLEAACHEAALDPGIECVMLAT